MMESWATEPYFTPSYKVNNLLDLHVVTTASGKLLPIGSNVSEVSICCHSDTPVGVYGRHPVYCT